MKSERNLIPGTPIKGIEGKWNGVPAIYIGYLQRISEELICFTREAWTKYPKPFEHHSKFNPDHAVEGIVELLQQIPSLQEEDYSDLIILSSKLEETRWTVDMFYDKDELINLLGSEIK